VRGVSSTSLSASWPKLDAGQKQKEITHLARVAMLGPSYPARWRMN